jgi:hypothetical protein
MQRMAVYPGWVLIALSGVVLAEGWQPWATIVGVVSLVCWVGTVADFVWSRRPALRRQQGRSRHGYR